jgi:hypothetical protein
MNSPMSSSVGYTMIGYTMDQLVQNLLYRPYHPLVWVDIKDWGKQNE